MTPTPRRVHPDVLPPVHADTPTAEDRHALTRSDRGRLPALTRRVLVSLLQGPYLARALHPNLWPVLVVEEDLVRERLGDLFLDLVLDQESGVAFVRPMTDDEVDLPRTIRSMPLTYIDTVLALFLRERLLRASGGRVFVGRDEIDEHCEPFRSAEDTNLSLYAKRVNASVSKFKDASILRTTNEEDRFEISPVLGLVFDADVVSAVTAELRQLAGEVAEPSSEDDS
ncbi:MAG: DUF4194 domain-containing protein [Micropruina sp.]|nr:DUF4194 domain-containing protein [Micropruina sp.]